MSLDELRKGNLETYVTQNKFGDDLVFFVHIPKTAGSSFRLEMSSARPPDVNVHVDGDDRPVPHKTKILDALARFRLKHARDAVRFASGHVTTRELLGIMPDYKIKLITFLRDPVERVISEFRYQRTRAHPDHASFIARYPTMDRYLDQVDEQDKIFNYLKPSQDCSAEECFEFVVDRFCFVGLIESYSASFRLAMLLNNSDRQATQWERRTNELETEIVNITDDLRERIRRANEKDYFLYGKFRSMMDVLEDPAIDSHED